MTRLYSAFLCWMFLGIITLIGFYCLLSEFRAENKVERDYIRHDFKEKKAFERFIDRQPGKVVLFQIQYFQQQVLPYFDPANLIKQCKRRSQYDGGITAIGMNNKSGRFVIVENFPFLSFYQWCWNQRVQSSRHLYSHQWMSFQNQRFLQSSQDGSSVNLKALLKGSMDPLFSPQTLTPSALVAYHDIMMFSHRASSKSLPYFMHFMTRRVLTCAFGSMRLSFLPWIEARRYIDPHNCVLQTKSTKPEWIFSPRCNVKNLVRFAGFTVYQGQSVVIPPYMVYQIEHMLPSSKREKFEQCCVILQADYQVGCNRLKNWISFRPLETPNDGNVDDDDRHQSQHRQEEVLSSKTSFMKDEIELQNEAWGAHAKPGATFMKPEMNPPLKEETETQDLTTSGSEWLSDIVHVNQTPVNDVPRNLFSMAVSEDDFYRDEIEQQALTEQFEQHAKDFPERTSVSVVVDI